MSDDKPAPVASPESDVSPSSQATVRGDYFSLAKTTPKPVATGDARPNTCVPPAHARHPLAFEVGNQGRETDNTGDASATTPGETASSSGSSAPESRKGSVGYVTFRPPDNPSLPQGLKKPHGGTRIREASPPHRSRTRNSLERGCWSLEYSTGLEGLRPDSDFAGSRIKRLGSVGSVGGAAASAAGNTSFAARLEKYNRLCEN
ncbi:hypothetical protein F5B18DRAFT_652783 [Nemania serpens]|nr:hypothetical protein F5B18DRAFT_652783 [Nemania serpens]